MPLISSKQNTPKEELWHKCILFLCRAPYHTLDRRELNPNLPLSIKLISNPSRCYVRQMGENGITEINWKNVIAKNAENTL